MSPASAFMSQSRLSGKVLVVIGGTSGIGLAAVRAFVREGAGIVVVGLDQSQVLAVEHEFADAVAGLAADATHSATAPTAIQLAVERFGALHGLYHVAGGSGRSKGDGPLDQISDEGWDQTLQLNLTSVFYSNRAAAQQFLRQGTGGSVLNMGSVLGFSPSARFFGTHAYAAAKAAIVGLTKSAAAAYAKHNLRFNVLAPGLVATPMSQRAQSNPEIMTFIKQKQPLDGGRIGAPEDLAAAAVWLLSEESKFVTGQVVTIDGGWSVSG